MAETWANFAGPDLHLDVTRPRVRARLEVALRDAVRDGRLRPGSALPSSRVLARDLGIARNTVADVYGQLVAEGWLTARQGSGTRVAGHAAATAGALAPPRAAARRFRYDLRPGVPDLAAFPRAAWLAATRHALASAPYHALGYGAARGAPELRHALAEYLARARGVRAEPEQIVVCSGFGQALVLLCEALRARGAKALAVEEYGHQAHRELIAASGLRVHSLPLDGRGALVGALSGCRAVLLTPAHQFPTGVPLHPTRRTQVVAWAAATGGLVIEDDYDGEFRFDRQAIGALQALATDQVVYAGTASKTLAPGLRLGWLVSPPALLEQLVAAKARSDRLTGIVDQLALARFISSGQYDRHVRRARLAYRRRHERLIDALATQVPAARVSGVAAGLHVLVELPPGQTEQEVIARAARHGLALDRLSNYAPNPVDSRPEALVIGYATPPEHAFGAAIARLCAVLSAR